MWRYQCRVGVEKMSWDSYIDNLIAQTKDAAGTAHVDKACIIGLDGGAAWTTAGHASAFKVCRCRVLGGREGGGHCVVCESLCLVWLGPF